MIVGIREPDAALAMARTQRVLAALSGGVDSSVAALLLKQAGYDVVGVFLRNGVEAPKDRCRPQQGCCSVEDASDAARVADLLDLPYHALDMAQEFHEIRRYFRSEYERGHTPNPCVVCNRDIKFGALMRFADAIEADFVATGHYAQVRHGRHGAELWRGRDRRKDQSYVLFPIGPEALARTLLPLGGLEKSETRRMAREAGLPTYSKPDSQEICFVPTGDYRDMLAETGGLGEPGRFLDRHGRELGRHGGHMGFTRGQRRGLGIAWSEPLYVLNVDIDSGDVLVGPRSELGSRAATVESFVSFACELAPGECWDRVEIQYRSSPGGLRGRACGLDDGRVQVEFDELAPGVTPGQGLAIYRGERLLGGGWIGQAELVPAEQLEV